MTNQPKIIKQQDKPVPPDLRRLACAMRAVLRRHYPDPVARQVATYKIMQEMKVA